MRYSVADLAAMLRTPVGRRQLAYGLRYRAWPLYAAAARVHRRRLEGRTRFVAVVGSFGKSTTTRATMAALGRSERWDGNNSWSSIAAAILRTPAGEPHSVVEVGIDGPGQMRRFAALLRPHVTVVTSVGSEHHRSLGSLERTRDEKAEMVRVLSPEDIAVLNGDDPNVLWMANETRARVVTYGFGEENDVVGRDVALDWPHGTRLSATTRSGASVDLRTRLVGTPMAYATLAALATAHAEGRDFALAAAGLEAMAPTPGRLEAISLPSGAWVLRDDFKSALETMHAALDVLEQIPARRRLVVVGEVSEPVGRQGPIYRALGERLARLAARVVVLGGSFQALAVGARRAGMSSDAIVHAGRSTAQAVDLLGPLGPGDVVLVKGRDTERLDRVALALSGVAVGCDIPRCVAKVRCKECPMLESGWGGRRVVL